ncbi:MAG TPA: hypothetical protein VIK40_07850 [Geomonas sp.]
MSALACNVVSYRPDPDMLAARFRPWHVEALLNQAATLIDRCLEDFREYSSLDYAWNQFQADLEIQEKQLEFDKRQGAGIELAGASSTAEDQGNPSEVSQESLDETNVEMIARSVDVNETEEQPVSTTPGVSARSSLELRAEALLRRQELSAPGRPLALNEQRDLALKRVCRDYEEAVNRACVAEEGLKKIYDHVEPSSPLSYEAETLGLSITNLSIWIRNAIEWLVGYQQFEQTFTRVVSVRALLNRSAWVQLKQTRDSFSTKLQVPEDLFRGYENCRVQGIGASLIGEAGTVPWSIMLRLPDEAVYERSGQTEEVDQSSRASCLLGRVENRLSVHPLEICGVTTLINASPIGRSTQGGLWSLELFKPWGATSETFSHVEDVALEIHIVGTPQKTNS